MSEPVRTDCYCNTTGTKKILEDICARTIPDAALSEKCCWSEISRVRSHNLNVVDRETWVAICTRRGDRGGFSSKPPYLPKIG